MSSLTSPMISLLPCCFHWRFHFFQLSSSQPSHSPLQNATHLQ